MSSNPSLDRLCDYYGIAHERRGPDGREQTVPAAARRALLDALGVETGSAEIERQSLRRALDRDWRRMLPPVIVLWEDATALRLPLTLPEHTQPSDVQWRLHQEHGDVASGTLSHEHLEPTGAVRRIEGQHWSRWQLDLPRPDSIGWHRLELHSAGDETPLATVRVILAPLRGYQPEALQEDSQTWGLATQLDAVRSARNWGIGDFTDLTRLIELLAERGGGALAVPPLHAHLGAQTSDGDPYRPASRHALEPLYIDVESIPELAECEQVRAEIDQDAFQAQLRALRVAAVVDRAAVARVKLGVLWRLFQCFQANHLATDSPRAHAFQAFREAGGEPLRHFALHAAIAAEGLETSPVAGPQPSPDDPEVRAFSGDKAERLDFQVWLQWHARQQLQAVGRRSLGLHLALGLCPTLAAGTAPEGAEAWAEPGLFIRGTQALTAADADCAEPGPAPGLAWSPIALRELGYAPFARLLRANMAEAGALRIQQIAGLWRQRLVPSGYPASEACVLAYPFEELLAVLTLESVRQRCLIIGEDGARLPAQVREALAQRGALGSAYLYCEQAPEGGFVPPAEYPSSSAVAVGHEALPPLAGFWRGSDLEQRRRQALFTQEQTYEQALVRRSNDRARLFLALDREGLLPENGSTDPVAVPELTPAHLRAIHLYLARTPSCLLWVQTADLLGEAEPAFLPGSGDAYPNWRRRQPLEIERWLDQPPIVGLLAAVQEARGRAEAGDQPQGGTAIATERALIPRATYRLQLHAGFGFAAAAELAPYLAQLGISHCYFSPYFKARPGSTHGYDVVDHDQLNPELGTREDYDRLCEAIAAVGMSQILDVVPNHVGVMGGENPWWLDVLENGQASSFADYFDIDWEPLKPELRGKILIPVLGDHYGNIIDSGALTLVFDAGAFRVEYYEHQFPIDPREYPRILAPELTRLHERLGAEHPDLQAFESLVTAFGNLPARDRLDAQALTERRRDKELHKHRLAALCAQNPDIDRYLQECLTRFNGATDYPPDLARLHELLEAQPYRLAHWRVAADDINYRRFFDINDLAALRMENPQALESTHRLVLELIAEGRLAGLRIDHPDGLYDPAAYFRWIQERALAVRRTATQPPADADRPIYLVVEKILMGDEQLPADWPVHGTSGYDFAALTDALLVDPAGAEPLTRFYQDFTEDRVTLEEEIYAAKRLVMRNLLSSELQVLATELSRIAETDLHTRDYTQGALRDALMEIVACFPVYRTYIASAEVSPRDRNQILKAVSDARRRSGAADLSVFGFVQDVLLIEVAQGKPAAMRERVLRLAMKLQQYTGPVTAKGIEDTAYYRYSRLVSLNEVGQDAERFGIGIDSYHRANRLRRERWPHAMLAGSTHDSKRSEDVRARLHLISEIPEIWRGHVERWTRLHRRFRRQVGERSLPDPATEYLFYQTLLGVWPLQEPDAEGLAELQGRLGGYMEKAVKEAKAHTAWTNADSDYEAALADFVAAVLDRERNAAFFEDFLPLQRRIARLGLYNSLSQALLRLTAPGVPDLYQGSELWSFSLVDPDNRRPVDFGQRRALLDALAGADAGGRASLASELAASPEDGRAKLYLIHRALELRRQDPELFAEGDYLPLRVEGLHAERLCAFARRLEGRTVMVLAPRHLAALALTQDSAETSLIDPFADPGWEETFVEAPADRLEDQLSGALQTAEHGGGNPRLCVARLLRRFPVGLLGSQGKSHVGS